MSWDHVYNNRHIMQEFEDVVIHKTSVSVAQNMNGLEILLLDKIPGKENICVKPIHQLYDHQIDGLRFIFKKWKAWKNKSHMKPSDYCVLSFPPKQGKSTTVSLFLYAVHSDLNLPILILCKDDAEVHNWRSHLKKWTGFLEDQIAVDPYKALINKVIFLKKYSDVSKLAPFCRRSWSFVVIKSDIFVSLPHFNNVEFTIWITSADLIKNLRLIKSMHSWILPKVEFKIPTDILPRWKNEILKYSMLESFALIRTANSLNCQENQSFESSTERKRLKNKDASGLKVKRSRQNAQNTHDEIHKKLDVEAFIRNEKPVRSKDKEINEECYFDIEDTSAPVKETIHNATESDTNEEIQKDEVQILPKEKYEVHIEYNCDILGENNAEISTEKANIICNGEDLETISDPVKKTNKAAEDEVIRNDEVLEETSKIDTKHSNGSLKKENTETHIKKDKDNTDDSDLDSKLNEMQERAMKKFKGSFLDSLF